MDAFVNVRATVRLWGDFRVVDSTGAPIEISNRKARACLALLACAADAMSRDRLAAMLWGDRSDTQARANLRQLLYELKPLTQASCAILGFDRHNVWLESGCELDTSALLRCESSDLAAMLPARGVAFLADLDGISEEFDEWLAPERASAETALRRIVQMRLEASLARRDFAAVRTLADAWAARDASDETLAQSGLRADAALQDTAGLARRFNRLASALATEMGVKPSAATAALAGELSARISLHGAQAVSASSTPATAATPRRRQGAGTWRTAAAFVAAVLGLCAVWMRDHVAVLPTTRPEAERMTAHARQLSHGRTPTGSSDAAALAHRAIAADPTYAPAWAELALASYLSAPVLEPALRSEILGYLDRAIALQPRLGRAESIRGMIVGGAQASPMLEQAVIDAPDDAEAWLWLCSQRAGAGAMREALPACRRAVELAPLWDRSVRAYANIATEARIADSAVDKVLDGFAAASTDRFTSESLRASVAVMRGDLMGAAKHSSLALTLAPENACSQIPDLTRVARAAGELDAVRRLASVHPQLKEVFAPLLEPEAAVARAQDAQAWWVSDYQEDDARQLLRTGRADLLLQLLQQQPLSLLELGGSWRRMALGAQFVVALRTAGRDQEADRLLLSIRQDLGRVAASGYSYFSLDLGNAVTSALAAEDEQAVAYLDQAVDKGWRGQFSDWSVDPADEPAFARLRGRSDFERVRARLDAEIGRVRPVISEILASTPTPVAKDVIADELQPFP